MKCVFNKIQTPKIMTNEENSAVATKKILFSTNLK